MSARRGLGQGKQHVATRGREAKKAQTKQGRNPPVEGYDEMSVDEAK